MADEHPDVLSTVEAAFRQHFEVAPARASVSFLGVEPIEVLRFPDDGRDHYVTLGMSRYAMIDPSAAVVDESSAPRSELLVTAGGRPQELWRRLAILAAAPAVEGVVYEVGNRVDLTEPWCAGSRCTGGVLTGGPLRPIPVRGATDVAVLQLLPATATELAWARVHGTTALRDRWTSARVDLTDLLREPVALD